MSCLRYLETTPFCPADIFPREGARSYRRMGIIAIVFLRQPPPCPFTGKGLGKGVSFLFFLEGESNLCDKSRDFCGQKKSETDLSDLSENN